MILLVVHKYFPYLTPSNYFNRQLTVYNLTFLDLFNKNTLILDFTPAQWFN